MVSEFSAIDSIAPGHVEVSHNREVTEACLPSSNACISLASIDGTSCSFAIVYELVSWSDWHSSWSRNSSDIVDAESETRVSQFIGHASFVTCYRSTLSETLITTATSKDREGHVASVQLDFVLHEQLP